MKDWIIFNELQNFFFSFTCLCVSFISLSKIKNIYGTNVKNKWKSESSLKINNNNNNNKWNGRKNRKFYLCTMAIIFLKIFFPFIHNKKADARVQSQEINLFLSSKKHYYLNL